jgi:starch synthase
MRYGTIPVVRETGGLKDTVVPYNEYTKEGTGFSFTNYNAHEMLFTAEYAVTIYNKKEHWNTLIKNAMSAQNSWEFSAKKYLALYKKLF